MKKFIFIIFLIWNFLVQDHSWSFDNNKENYNRDKREWIPYTVENISKGILKGGHDTITSEVVVLKKEVHRSDPDGGREFQRWADEQALPMFRAGVRDEDIRKSGWVISMGRKRRN